MICVSDLLFWMRRIIPDWEFVRGGMNKRDPGGEVLVLIVATSRYNMIHSTIHFHAAPCKEEQAYSDIPTILPVSIPNTILSIRRRTQRPLSQRLLRLLRSVITKQPWLNFRALPSTWKLAIDFLTQL